MNILLSSVGRRSYLVRYFQQALAGRGMVIATNSIADATGMLAADRAVVIPPAGDHGFVEQLLSVCHQYKVRLLCSLHDWEAPFIAQAADRFKDLGVVPIISDTSVLNICLDKYTTWEFAHFNGIRCPKTVLGKTAAIHSIASGSMSYPLVVKPRYGQGSIAVETVFSEDELHCACNLAESKLARIESNNLVFKPGEENLIVQELIDGIEYGLDVVNDLHARFATCIVKRKLAMRAGETDAAETVDHPELQDFGRLIGTTLRHIGMLDVDVMMDRHGPCLLEANPRFGGHYPFSHVAGANIPAALIAWVQDHEPDPGWLMAKSGVRCLKDIRLVMAVDPGEVSL